MNNEVRVIAEVYMYTDNGGTSLSVIDDGESGPIVRVSSSSFGNQALEFDTYTDIKSLKALRDMFDKAISFSEYSEEFCNKASVE